ncbi:hypothetical protein KIN20_035687 [Parelaphostrongylus tenuis]|uniref:Uncharacterized protein n=1 Tax=Parelaphostrongylus tenuis TaxID=148309 RepID=A0AAD5RBT4_PARTN|nr:hypothetical protein KIN20_035687 [Parelaphostrongylus tenuis]
MEISESTENIQEYENHGMKLEPAAMFESNHHHGRQSREEGMNGEYAEVRTICEDAPS